MKSLLVLFFAFSAIITYAQPGSVTVGAVRSKVEAVDTTTAVTPISGYGVIFFNKAQNKFRVCYGGTCYDLAVSTGGGSVTSVSGTLGRITSSGGATPAIDISPTFEALLGKLSNPLSQFAATSSLQLRGTLTDELGTGAALFDGATPTGLVLTNATGLPVGSITGLGTGVGTWLASPTWSNSPFTGTAPFWLTGGATSLISNVSITGNPYTFSYSSTQSGTGTTSYTHSSSNNLTANSQTTGAYDFPVSFNAGAFTPYTFNIFRLRDVVSGDYMRVHRTNTGIAFTWDLSSVYNFQNGASTSIMRNLNGAYSIVGGSTTSINGLMLSGSSSTTNNYIATSVTGNFYTSSSGAITRTNSGMVMDYDAVISGAGVGGTLNHNVLNIVPTFNMAGSTLNIFGVRYAPAITATIGTHYGLRIVPVETLNGVATDAPVSTWDISGSFGKKQRTTTATTTLNGTDYQLWADTSSGNITVNLPAAASVVSSSGSAREYKIKKMSASNTLTLDPFGAEQIEFASTLVLSSLGDVVTISTNGTAWFITEN